MQFKRSAMLNRVYQKLKRREAFPLILMFDYA